MIIMIIIINFIITRYLLMTISYSTEKEEGNPPPLRIKITQPSGQVLTSRRTPPYFDHLKSGLKILDLEIIIDIS